MSPRIVVPCLLMALLITACGSWDPKETSGKQYTTTRDGYYRVKKGDSLHAIAFRFGLDWRNIAQWNNIRSPYVIYPDQELRLSAPSGQAAKSSKASGQGVAVSGARTPGSSTTREAPVEKKPVTKQPDPASRTTTQPKPPPVSKPQPQKTQVPKSQQPASPATGSVTSSTPDPKSWTWPVDGRLLSRFKAGDPSRNGIDIGGTEGQAIKATAAGEVVYSGNGLISYGELIIIKHSDRMLSAYGHNRKRLVKEGDLVGSGQTIAEMGRNDRNQALLHFEIRANGTPQDPLKYLPKR